MTFSANLGDTETQAHERVRKSTERLFALLTEHHDYRVPKPPKAIPIYVVPPVQERIEVCVLPVVAPRITVDAIKRVVCRHYGLTHNEMVSPRRDHKVGRPRMIAIYLAREFTPFGLPALGKRFNRDHTSILHSVRKMTSLIATDPAIAADVQSLTDQLTA